MRLQSHLRELAVEHLYKVDTVRTYEPDYKKVQKAKLVHRMASGSHKYWTNQELHKYPQPRGRILRHLGEMIEDATFMVVAGYMETVA